MLSTKDLYMKACLQSHELHAMTDDERAQLQSHLRGMYVEIEKVCDKHNLRMCVAYGTALGAIGTRFNPKLKKTFEEVIALN